MPNPCDPWHSAAIQEFMARDSIGDPATLNTGLLIVLVGHVDAVRAKVSGTMIRCAHEQLKFVPPKASDPTAKPVPKKKSWEWSAQFGGVTV
jgi:hypothetical protein